jgi:predicted DNA-binding protein with PD1-like motif
MEDTVWIGASEFRGGRSILGRLPRDKDLLAGIEELCAYHAIQIAVFSIIGSVTSLTLGAYDQNQQVYVTFKREEPFEIVHCTGNVSRRDDELAVHAHGVFADMKGNTLGGHVFSKTMIYAGEIFVQELLGKPLDRGYDEDTGLYLWKSGPRG